MQALWKIYGDFSSKDYLGLDAHGIEGVDKSVELGVNITDAHDKPGVISLT